ncbi:putative bifunctional diguanylate cyclase/phosphodiesterase [Roseovarius aestuariivivens]|uniref:putative bifunctional diguanylate cyclase/phosphodiesterase n=1 Tax=Roseovarius aestuariivivens TaxID=1888910 RepID=UPI001081D27A|nr:bifunctional diguanylate cyclase/phosphodiesterase [Roseovarius aestuariivivens]
MRPSLFTSLTALRHSLATGLSGPQALAFLPAVVLAGFWLGGEPALLATALAFPLLLALVGAASPTPEEGDDAEGLEAALDDALEVARRCLRKTGCFLIEVDDFDLLLDRHGQAAADRVMGCAVTRIGNALRDGDKVVKLGRGQIGVALSPVRQVDSETGLKMAARLQAAVEEPVALDNTTVYVSASVGLCLDVLMPGGSGRDLADAAGMALREARRHAPSAIRAYTPELRGRAGTAQGSHDDVRHALEARQICAWFQPQLCTDTGGISGFEALARWHHPTQGIVPPDEFLPAIKAMGQSERLGEIILQDALNAMKAWAQAGYDIPHVGVNFCPEELRDPKLPDRVAWDIDRAGLTPGRLAVEILESVVASTPDDTVTRNIRRLSEMGCLIDLDDFGTGHASISSIRRFAVQRLKIDRSFVRKIDCDPEQRRMVNAIQLMAEQLDLETLAEGVETAGEHAMLAQLGCGHVQGFGIARPMPLKNTLPWIETHLARLQSPPPIGRKTG